MNINSDGAEIDVARDMEVYGDWIKFVDGEGATVKIVPSVIRELYEFAMAHAEEFDEGAWNIDWQPVFATHQNLTKEHGNSPRVGSSSDDDDPLLRLPEVLKRVPVSRSHWWAGVASGRYPAPVRLSVRCVAWRASSIRALIASL